MELDTWALHPTMHWVATQKHKIKSGSEDFRNENVDHTDLTFIIIMYVVMSRNFVSTRSDCGHFSFLLSPNVEHKPNQDGN